eukprot:Rmarinus@m.15952
MSLKQPVGQKLLTNVAVVRLKRKGIRFEIACYKNKVMSWRDGTETDIDEVLQIQKVFKSVSKGIVANQKDLTKAFGDTATHDSVCREILNKGEYQFGDKEREVTQDNLLSEVVTIVASKTVDPETNRPIPVGVIERALADIHFNPKSNKSAKHQALEAIRLLSQTMSIKRAQMRLRAVAPNAYAEDLKKVISDFVGTNFEEEFGFEYALEFLADPGHFRGITSATKEATQGEGSVSLINLCETEEGDRFLE